MFVYLCVSTVLVHVGFPVNRSDKMQKIDEIILVALQK